MGALFKAVVPPRTSGELREPSTPSPTSLPMTKQQFAESMLALVALKRTMEFSKIQLWAWFAVLNKYPWPVLNRAVLETALSNEAFPDIKDVVEACDRHYRVKQYCPSGVETEWKPPKSMVEDVARELGLEV